MVPAQDAELVPFSQNVVAISGFPDRFERSIPQRAVGRGAFAL